MWRCSPPRQSAVMPLPNQRLGTACLSWAHLLRLVAVIVLVAFASLNAATPVSAHANLAQTDPPAQSVLSRAPSRVQLVFTEAVEPRSIDIQVLNAQRQRVDAKNAALSGNTNDTIVAGLTESLPDGVYTIQWKVTSAVDGHTTQGLVPFTVGDPGAIPDAPLNAGASSTGSSGGWPGAVGRWLAALGLLVLTGGFAFVATMLRPALRHLDDLTTVSPERVSRHSDDALVTEDTARAVASAAGRRLVIVLGMAAAVLLAGMLLQELVEAAQAAGGSLFDAIGGPMIDHLTGSRRGSLWLGRFAFVVLALICFFSLVPRLRRTPRAVIEQRHLWLLLMGLGLGALLVQSFGSHISAVKSQTVLATVVAFIHLAAVAVWVGGLVTFGLVLLPALGPLGGPPRTKLLALLIPRFSAIAETSVAIVVFTGVYETIRLLGGLRAFTSEGWGQALLVKLGLFGLLILVAAFNLLWVSPRLRALATRLDRPAREFAVKVRTSFRRALMAEIGLAVAVLAVVGVLAGQPPKQATSFSPSGPFRPFILTQSAQGLNARLVMSPGRVGLNRFDITLTDQNGRQSPAKTEVVMRMTTIDQDTGIIEARTEALGGGRYTASGSYLSIVGLWSLSVLVREPGRDEIVLPFEFSLGAGTGQIEVREKRPAAPIERGRELYQNNCANCHGSTGKGDGPLAGALQPRPVDLTIHVPQHPDAQLREWIENGVPRTAMPAWKGQFTEDEVQAIVNYLRQLAEEGAKDR